MVDWGQIIANAASFSHVFASVEKHYQEGLGVRDICGELTPADAHALGLGIPSSA
jgi:hypothetical protein